MFRLEWRNLELCSFVWVGFGILGLGRAAIFVWFSLTNQMVMKLLHLLWLCALDIMPSWCSRFSSYNLCLVENEISWTSLDLVPFNVIIYNWVFLGAL